MEFVLLKIGSPEWEYAWNWLASHPINNGIENPSVALNENEAWQYVGTYKKDNKGITEFRHRLHPVSGYIMNLYVEHEITDEGIEKKFRV